MPAFATTTLSVAGADLSAVARSGDQPALVFLHYWGGSKRTWQPVIDRLPATTAVLAYDQRGWGGSAGAPGPYGLAQLAADAEHVLAGLGYDRVVLVGHSMGGKVAQMVAARRPRGLVGLVLVAPAPAAPAAMTAQLQELTSRAYDDEQAVQQSVDHMLTEIALPADVRRQIVEDSLSAGDEAKYSWPTTGLAQDVSAGVGAIGVPTLIVAGEHDKVEPPALLRAHVLSLIPQATMTVLAGTGHLSPLEVPDQVAAAITEFTAAL
ncbi:alpha/beta fold hydrolase [Mycolicibacterium komossense]|uniref:Alpha/beta fold hydrolase n=1 Tax=Mycolicibacterium komossense TaxID=1779 RepID=A0ABT3CJM2_9MYCO|nr:alpha/beta hydrolase [Mycolicibacterium komossense]MCV7229693.1 alpha/beta fold hydrolase [Mycolicibacterium komossense]